MRERNTHASSRDANQNPKSLLNSSSAYLPMKSVSVISKPVDMRLRSSIVSGGRLYVQQNPQRRHSIVPSLLALERMACGRWPSSLEFLTHIGALVWPISAALLQTMVCSFLILVVVFSVYHPYKPLRYSGRSMETSCFVRMASMLRSILSFSCGRTPLTAR